MLLLALVLAIGGVVLWRFVGNAPVVSPTPASSSAGAKSDSARPAASMVAEADPRSIAVLPFLNMSDDKNNQYFADGISEELLNVLVRVNGFSVASRTSSFAFKGREVGTPEIAKALKVRYVVEGSVRKQGDEVRITAQLIDASDDRHLWSETYDRKLADIFRIQSDIANAIVAAVGKAIGKPGTMPAVAVKADTANLNAYESFLKARELFLSRSDLKESIRLYEHAVKLDPNFARGWEGLSAAYSVMPGWGFVDRDYLSLADQAAKRALDLDPKLSMAWAVLGSNEQNRDVPDWAKGIEMLNRAIAVDPHNSTALLWRAVGSLNLGFFDRAIADLDHCLQLDPHYGNCRTWKAFAMLQAGQTERALALYDQAMLAGDAQSHTAEFMAASIRHGDRIQAVLLMQAWGATPRQARVLVAAIGHPESSSPAVAQQLEADFQIRKICL
ncbi:MAG: tetratricopeptide repeat protein [Rhodanobacteraceae bacterium]